MDKVCSEIPGWAEFLTSGKEEDMDDLGTTEEFTYMSGVLKMIAPEKAVFTKKYPGLSEKSAVLDSPKFASYAIGDEIEVQFKVMTKTGKRLIIGTKRLTPTKPATIQTTPVVETPKVLAPANTAPDPLFADKIFFPSNALQAFQTGLKIAKKRGMFNILIFGGSGYGKTTLPKQFAKANEMSYIRVNCASIRDTEEWFGYRELVNGDTKFNKTQLVEVLEKGNAVICLDEFNRIEPWLHNTLFGLLDSGETHVHGYDIKLGPTVLFVATVNLGVEFTGTFELDTALRNRFNAKFSVGPLPADKEVKVLETRTGVEEIKANAIVRTMGRLRKEKDRKGSSYDASTRVSIQVAEFMAEGLTMNEAFEFALVNELSPTEAKEVLDAIGVETR